MKIYMGKRKKYLKLIYKKEKIRERELLLKE